MSRPQCYNVVILFSQANMDDVWAKPRTKPPETTVLNNHRKHSNLALLRDDVALGKKRPGTAAAWPLAMD